MKVGYICLGPTCDDALLIRHRELLREAGCHPLFVDVGEDETQRRPGLAEATQALNGSGSLVVTRLSHLGGSVTEAVWTICRLNALGLRLQSLEPRIDTGYASGQLVIQTLEELTRTLCSLPPASIDERVALPEPRRGRRPVLTPQEAAAALTEIENGSRIADVARRYGVSRWTISRLR